MKIIDCFTFYNELDILEYRLNILYEHVDYFILVESTRTFSGNNNELFYNNNKSRYSVYNDKIIHIIVDDMPETNNAWDREYHQRRCIDRGIQQLNLNDNDLIVISDLDEIPNINTLKSVPYNNSIYSLEQDLYYYNILYKVDIQWMHPKCLYYNIYKNIRDCEKIRMYTNTIVLKNGGWHLSYFGNVSFIINKIKQFAHQEYNNDIYLNNIEQYILSGKDIFNRNIIINKIEISDNNNLPPKYTLLISMFNNL